MGSSYGQESIAFITDADDDNSVDSAIAAAAVGKKGDGGGDKGDGSVRDGDRGSLYVAGAPVICHRRRWHCIWLA